MNYPIHYPDFFTATILQWQKLLQPNRYKTVITNSFKYLVEEKRVQVLGFVIMYNYIHENPMRAGICNVPEDYRYSSASLYANDTSEWNFLEDWG